MRHLEEKVMTQDWIVPKDWIVTKDVSKQYLPGNTGAI
jgi:hypothetical protein